MLIATWLTAEIWFRSVSSGGVMWPSWKCVCTFTGHCGAVCAWAPKSTSTSKLSYIETSLSVAWHISDNGGDTVSLPLHTMHWESRVLSPDSNLVGEIKPLTYFLSPLSPSLTTTPPSLPLPYPDKSSWSVQWHEQPWFITSPWRPCELKEICTTAAAK